MKNKFSPFVLSALLFATSFWSMAQENPAIKSTPTLTLELATRMMEVAARRAEELNEAVTIVIVGTDGLPLTIRRHEESPSVIYEQALQSAQSAWIEKKETGSGLPILSRSHRLGGIGVAGADQNLNKKIGRTAVEIFEETLQNNVPVQSAKMELLKIILYVRAWEIAETADFYRNAIGLQQMNPENKTGWIVFNTGTVNLCLRAKDRTSIRVKTTNLAIYGGTREEVKALHARLIEDGYKVTTDINPKMDKTMGRLREEKTMTTFWIKDPAGNTVQIESLRTN